MRLALYLDTSVQGFAIALKEIGGESGTLFKVFESSKSASSFKLSSLIKDKFEALDLSEDAIKVVLVSRGPGSFTGIRIGLSWAYGFCAAKPERTLIGLSSFKLLCSYLARTKNLSACSILLANTKTTGFLAEVKGDEEPSLSFIDEKTRLEMTEKGQALFVDSFYENEIGSSSYTSYSKEEISQLSLEALIEQVDLEDPNFYNDVYPATALYLRQSAAQERLS